MYRYCLRSIIYRNSYIYAIFIIQYRFIALVVNNGMLTVKEKARLVHANYIAPHLRYFCQKWSTADDCPPHFEDMMRRFLDLGFKEQLTFYIIDDVLHTVEQYEKTNYRLMNPNNSKYRGDRAWVTSTSKSRY